ncbi:phosphoribosylformylglycinamidine synthase subunit PurS [Pullulanibacillus camelliae]|uniref:Phosphoribosylformylglycinamidine synthase subunit PurS n=1 Tax=Pullulanibacillus camelliae TaxID=1707096 RepID=A0A8J2VPB7_9BACL|nr:phosphoribosylformylglycinamidine synthase subunit PurS [Pullulanibacillus camelliae]GGE35660.1 phosphoribosylformylglycinamidine synthase subunit PurS [Pullulanibacillus camelliae]
MKKVKVYITLKESVLDPQGQAVAGAMHHLGYQEVKDVRIGKFIELEIDSEEEIDDKIRAICEKLLANTVIENYRYEIEEGVPQ